MQTPTLTRRPGGCTHGWEANGRVERRGPALSGRLSPGTPTAEAAGGFGGRGPGLGRGARACACRPPGALPQHSPQLRGADKGRAGPRTPSPAAPASARRNRPHAPVGCPLPNLSRAHQVPRDGRPGGRRAPSFPVGAAQARHARSPNTREQKEAPNPRPAPLHLPGPAPATHTRGSCSGGAPRLWNTPSTNTPFLPRQRR